jgi:hypothetical protein
MGTLQEDISIFLTISRKILLRMRIALDKSCGGNQSTHFMFNNFFFPENRTVYEMSKNVTVGGGGGHK